VASQSLFNSIFSSFSTLERRLPFFLSFYRVIFILQIVFARFLAQTKGSPVGLRGGEAAGRGIGSRCRAFIFRARSIKDENGKEGMYRDFHFGNVGNRPLRSKRAVVR
jgi:hypothetical protein